MCLERINNHSLLLHFSSVDLESQNSDRRKAKIKVYYPTFRSTSSCTSDQCSPSVGSNIYWEYWVTFSSTYAKQNSNIIPCYLQTTITIYIIPTTSQPVIPTVVDSRKLPLPAANYLITLSCAQHVPGEVLMCSHNSHTSTQAGFINTLFTSWVYQHTLYMLFSFTLLTKGVSLWMTPVLLLCVIFKREEFSGLTMAWSLVC